MTAAAVVSPPTDITLPDDGSTTVRSLLSLYLRAQYRALLTIPFASLTGGGSFGPDFIAHLRELSKSDPGIVFSILRRPTIGGLIRLITVRDGNPAELDAWCRELLAHFGFELSLVGHGFGRVPPPKGMSRLLSLQRGVALPVPPGTTDVAFDGFEVTFIAGSDRRTIDLQGAAPTTFESPYFEIDGGITLAVVDNNPRAGLEAHPDKEGNHIDLGGKSADDWVTSLRSAYAIVGEFAPTLIPEIELLIHQIIPVGYDDEKHLSASLTEVIGNIYMSLHPDPLVMAEAIIHEFSHNKINMLWTLAPLLENAFHPLYASPVRPDKRPLFGVLLAVHAFLPVEHMYEGLASSRHPLTHHPRFAARRAQIRRLNDEAAKTVLEHGIAVGPGVAVLSEIRRLNDRFAASV